jgi:polysaccharide export outer membrane protein
MTQALPVLEAARHAAAQALVHFAWQGAALWIVAACALHVLRAATPQARYALFCGMLALAAACPAVTFCLAFERPAAIADVSAASLSSPIAGTRVEVHDGAAISRGRWTTAATTLAARIARHEPWLVAIWLAGGLGFAARLVVGTTAVSAIKRRRAPLPAHLVPLVNRMIGQLAFHTRPAVYVVDQLSQAMAVGLIRPLVLLPASWLAELPPSVLETVIAHELAHLRRWDLAINFAQRIVECALFYHPMVWWCSRRMRIEREICCDALALAAVQNRTRYAQALAYLADRRIAAAEPLVAAGIGGPQMVLLERIRHVLGTTTRKQSPFFGLTCAAAGAAAASLVWLAVMAMIRAPAEPAARSPQIAQANDPADSPYQAPQEIGAGVNSTGGLAGRAAPGAENPIPANVPSEFKKTLLPDYTIEPPDVLFIEVIRVVPKNPYRIRTGDVLRVERSRDLPVAEDGRHLFAIDASGGIDLGPNAEGWIKALGLSEDEARAEIRKKLAFLPYKDITVALEQSAAMQPITGEHLVAPDGKVTLGMYGQVNIAGLTVAEAKAAIEKHLAEFLDEPEAAVTVFAYNSRVFYVITEGAGLGDTVARFPITGNETVLDALAQLSGFSGASKKKIWIARPQPGGGDTILLVDWHKITEEADTASNYQVLPGDRIFIADKLRQGPLKPSSSEPRAADRY